MAIPPTYLFPLSTLAAAFHITSGSPTPLYPRARQHFKPCSYHPHRPSLLPIHEHRHRFEIKHLASEPSRDPKPRSLVRALAVIVSDACASPHRCSLRRRASSNSSLWACTTQTSPSRAWVLIPSSYLLEQVSWSFLRLPPSTANDHNHDRISVSLVKDQQIKNQPD